MKRATSINNPAYPEDWDPPSAALVVPDAPSNPGLDMTDTARINEAARHLLLIWQDVRAYDIPLVVMDEKGAGRTDQTLADELFLIAYNLAPETALAFGRETEAKGQDA